MGVPRALPLLLSGRLEDLSLSIIAPSCQRRSSRVSAHHLCSTHLYQVTALLDRHCNRVNLTLGSSRRHPPAPTATFLDKSPASRICNRPPTVPIYHLDCIVHNPTCPAGCCTQPTSNTQDGRLRCISSLASLHRSLITSSSPTSRSPLRGKPPRCAFRLASPGRIRRQGVSYLLSIPSHGCT